MGDGMSGLVILGHLSAEPAGVRWLTVHQHVINPDALYLGRRHDIRAANSTNEFELSYPGRFDANVRSAHGENPSMSRSA